MEVEICHRLDKGPRMVGCLNKSRVLFIAAKTGMLEGMIAQSHIVLIYVCSILGKKKTEGNLMKCLGKVLGMTIVYRIRK